jgi:transcription initiation factor IIE alpha subunit
MHDHSLAAHREGGCDGTIGERAMQVMEAFLRRGPMTDRECMTLLGYSDPNTVRPRISELVRAKVLVECGRRRDSVTGKTVRVCRPRPAEQLFLENV